MQKKVLSNGLTVLYEERDSESVVIQVLVKIGSEHENKNNLGVAHFVEHRLFETKKRKQRQIASEIENLGGEINAFTSKETTNYYVYLPKKYFDKGLDIISDMLQNAYFDEKEIEKEKKIILEEVKLWSDDPKLHQWVLFEKELFNGHSAGNPGLGTIKSISQMKKSDLVEFYEKYYTPKNMIITIVGKIDNLFKKVENSLKDFNREYTKKEDLRIKPENKFKILKEKREIDHSYMLLGYKIPLRSEKESYTFDIISNILGYGLSSRLFDEIRTKRGLAYQVGVELEISKDLGFFGVFLSTDKKNIEDCKKIIKNEFEKLKELDKKDLEKARTSIEGNFTLKGDNPVRLALLYSYWEYIKDGNLLNEYVKNIKKVSLEDIKSVVNKYLNNDYTLVIIEQK